MAKNAFPARVQVALGFLLLCLELTLANGQAVYSVNLVGYAVREIPLRGSVTLAYACNPLNTIDNRLSSIFPDLPEGTLIYTYRNGDFQAHTYFQARWWPQDITLNPGEGVILALDADTASNPTYVVFLGEASVGALVNVIPPGFSLKASKLFRSGLITTQLNLLPAEDDGLLLFDEATQTLSPFIYFFGLWDPSEPLVPVSRSFWYYNGQPTLNQWLQPFEPLPTRDAVSPGVDPPVNPVNIDFCTVGPVMLGLRQSASEFEASWSIDFSHYQLQRSGSVDGTWANVAEEPLTVGARRQVVLPRSGSQEFFQLRTDIAQAPVLYGKRCPTDLVLYWHGDLNGYLLEQSDDPFTGLWATVPALPTLANGFWQVRVPGAALRYYRLARR